MMRDASLQTTSLLLSGLETAINRLLAYDYETLSALTVLSGKVIAIEITQPHWRVFVLPGDHGVSLTTQAPERIDVSITGRPTALLGMVAGNQDAGSQGHVEIRGDIHLAQRVQQIMQAADIDWEELLSTYVGDMAAHHLGRVGREISQYLRHVSRSLTGQFSEYLRHEQTLVPQRHEVDRFVESVDTLRDDVERAAQRLQRLEQQRGRGA